MMERIEKVTITGTSSELAGVGRLPDGRAVFVPGALPGEIVSVRVTREQDRFCLGEVAGIESASPDRAEPLCPFYGICGGCHAQHMTYEASLRLKRQAVYDALTRIGGVKDANVLPTAHRGEIYRTRNKAEYPVSRDGRYAGASKENSHEILNIPDCLQQKESSVACMRAFSTAGGLRGGKYLVTRFNRAGEGVAVLTGGRKEDAAKLAQAMRERVPSLIGAVWCNPGQKLHHALDGRMERLWGEETLEEVLLDTHFTLSPKSFFQVNPDATEYLYKKAVDAACETGGTVIDAYCGTGTMALIAAKQADAVGIEIVPDAVRDARENAKRNNRNARFICGDAAKELPRVLGAGSVILDPPRKGVDQGLLRVIGESQVRRVVYVSCNPATLARDVKVLAEYGFALESAEPVDMFPMTKHVETVAILGRQQVG